MAAQILAAAAASLSGPATSLSCMPSPVLLSFTTMIGCNSASGAFALDLRSPRHSARKPPSEFALPTSTPNSVRCTATFGSVSTASGSVLVEATTSGIGAATMGLAGFSGSISFDAAESGGAIIIDFGAASDAVGDVAGAVGAPGLTDEAVTAAGSAVAFVAGFSDAFAGMVAIGDMTGVGEGFCAIEDGSTDAEGGAAGEDVAGEDVGGEDVAEDTVGGTEAACGGAVGGFCRATVPVTESSPCSRTVTRE